MEKSYNISQEIRVKCRMDRKIVIYKDKLEADILEGIQRQLLIKFNGGNSFSEICKTEEYKKKLETEFDILIKKGYLVETIEKWNRDLTPKWSLDEAFFEISKNCNLNCRHCYIPKNIEKKEMKLQQWKGIVDECRELCVGLIKITGGEPMLAPFFWELIEYIANNDMKMRLYTNGSFLNGDTICRLYQNAVQEIQISLDGGNEDTHDSFRRTRGNFQTILKALPYLQKYNISVILSFTLSDYNENEIDEFLSIAYKFYNVKVVISPYINYHQTCNNNDILKVSDEMLDKLKKYFGENKVKWSDKTKYYLTYSNRFIGYCGMGNYMLYIDSTGKIYLCPLLNQDENIVGDLQNYSLNEIWENSELLKRYRKYTIADIQGCNTCTNSNTCRGGCRARAFFDKGSLLSKDNISCRMH